MYHQARRKPSSTGAVLQGLLPIPLSFPLRFSFSAFFEDAADEDEIEDEVADRYPDHSSSEGGQDPWHNYEMEGNRDGEKRGHVSLYTKDSGISQGVEEIGSSGGDPMRLRKFGGASRGPLHFLFARSASIGA